MLESGEDPDVVDNASSSSGSASTDEDAPPQRSRLKATIVSCMCAHQPIYTWLRESKRMLPVHSPALIVPLLLSVALSLARSLRTIHIIRYQFTPSPTHHGNDCCPPRTDHLWPPRDKRARFVAEAGRPQPPPPPRLRRTQTSTASAAPAARYYIVVFPRFLDNV